MDITIKTGSVQKLKSGCAIVAVHSGKRFSPSAQALDRANRGALTRIIKRGDLSGKVGETLLIPLASKAGADRVLLVGCGKASGVSAADYQSLLAKAASALLACKARSAFSTLAEVPVKGADVASKIKHQVRAFAGSAYRFTELKTKNVRTPSLARLQLMVPGDDKEEAQVALQAGLALQSGIALQMDLANRPGNVCTPSHLAEAARALGKEYRFLKVTVTDQAQMEKLGMGALLAVARGSREAPQLITMAYRGGAKDAKPVVLVGKGVTFDSGGISIKPSAGMGEMKFDMCGAASVIGVMRAVCELKLPLHVIGIVPAVENLPDGNAIKPGDVVHSMSGQTVEILNTDAEGRLILCDALTYAARFEPAVVIDIATLTGACVVALGSHASGLLSNDNELAEDLSCAGEASGDRVWRLPLWEDYQKLIDSDVADIANVGGREAGTITAACFLARFTREYTWAHLDIAGTAWRSGKPKLATGRPVALLVEYLAARAGNHCEA